MCLSPMRLSAKRGFLYIIPHLTSNDKCIHDIYNVFTLFYAVFLQDNRQTHVDLAQTASKSSEKPLNSLSSARAMALG